MYETYGIEDLLQGLEGAIEALECGEIELAGEDTGDVDTSGRRMRKSRRTSVKNAQPKDGGGSLSRDVADLKRKYQDLSRSLKQSARYKTVTKEVQAGNRAFFTASAAAVAAAGTGTITNVAASSEMMYDRIMLCGNSQGYFSAITVAGNPILDGSATFPYDPAQGPILIELNAPVKLNANTGVSASVINRGPATGDFSVVFIPVGHAGPIVASLKA